MPKLRYGVAMSGGSTKIYWHAGVLKGLWDLGIKPVVFGGTSAGALAAMLMTSVDPAHMINILLNTNSKNVFKWSPWTLQGVYSLSPINKLIDQYYDSSNPRNVIAFSTYCDHSGPPFEAQYAYQNHPDYVNKTIASASVPFWMQGGQAPFYDGGVVEYIPIRETAKHCDVIIASSTSPILQPRELWKKPFYVPEMLWAAYVAVDGSMQQEVKRGDFVRECEGYDVTVLAPTDKIDLKMTEMNREKGQKVIDLAYKLTMETVA